MSFHADLPEPFRIALRLAADERILISMRSDLDRDGRYGESYLVLTDRRLAAGDAAGVTVELPVEAVDELAVDELYSRSRLLAKTESGDIAIATYSSNLVNEFAVFVRVVNAHLAGGELVVPEPDAVEPALCPTCGHPLPERGAHCPQCLPRRAILRRMLGLLRPYRRLAAALLAITFVSVLMQMVPPYAMKEITDGVLHDGGRDAYEREYRLIFWVVLMGGAFLAMHATRLVSSWLNAWLASRVVADLRASLHRQLQRLSMNYHNKRESGELISRVTHDTRELQHFLIDGLPYFLVNSVAFVAIASILLWIDWGLAILVFIPVPLLVGGGHWFWRRLIPLFHKEGNRVSRLHSHLGESIRGVKAVKATVQESRRHRAFAGSNEGLRGVRYHLEATWFGFFEVMALTMSFGTLAVWYFGAGRHLADPTDFRLGDLIAFIGYMALFYGPLQWFAAVMNWFTHAVTCMQRIFHVIDHASADRDKPGAVELERVAGGVVFDDVRFSYERGKEVIKGVDLTIAPGEMIGLVGRSGSGKSTVINLLCRFFEPDAGRILVDGRPLTDVTYASWRRQVGIVMQDPFIFNASLLDNIRYARPEASFAEVVAAAKAAAAHEFILDKEEGYDTVVGEGGVTLSGGEKQRIAIARAVLIDPPILILDEATSAVDSETEKDIQAAIARLVEGRTTVAIAHRLATLREADRLVVIEDGRIVEQGSHTELLADPESRFARMVAMQTEINKIRSESHALDG